MEGGDIMKKVVKCLLLFTLCFLLLFNSTAFANSAIYEYFSGGGKDNLDIETVTSGVYSFLYTCGVILAVCILVTIAISYMVATPNKRAILKERLIYYFIGVIFLVGGLAFLRIYEKAAKDVGSIVYNGGSSSPIDRVHEDDQRVVNLEDLMAVSYSEIREMDYETLKDYVNDLDDARRELINAFNKEQEGGLASGQQQDLERSEDQLTFARKHLTELYEQQPKDGPIHQKDEDEEKTSES